MQKKGIFYYQDIIKKTCIKSGTMVAVFTEVWRGKICFSPFYSFMFLHRHRNTQNCSYCSTYIIYKYTYVRI